MNTYIHQIYDKMLNTFRGSAPADSSIEFSVAENHYKFMTEVRAIETISKTIAVIDIESGPIPMLTDKKFIADTYRELLECLAKNSAARPHVIKHSFLVSRYSANDKWYLQLNKMTTGPYDNEDTAYAAYLLQLENY